MGCTNSNLKQNSVNQKEGVVDLFVFPRTSKSIHLSPPCFKVESFLRWNKIPYIVHFVTDLSVSPTGRLPCAIIHNKLVADSELIISELIVAYNIQEDHVTAKAQREGRLLRVALEYATRWHVARWQLVDHFDWTVDASREYAPSVPRFVLKAAIGRMNRTPVIDMLNTHGQGDLSQEHYHDELLKDLQAVEGMMADTGGGFIVTADRPSRFDATVYAMLNIIRVAEEIKQDAPGAVFFFQSAVLQQYLKRMDELCFPDGAALMKAGASVVEQDFSTPSPKKKS